MTIAFDMLPQPSPEGLDRLNAAARQFMAAIEAEDIPREILDLARQLSEALTRHTAAD